MAEPNVSSKTIEAGHELSDLSPKHIAGFGLSLAILLIVVVVVTYLLHGHYAAVQTSTQAPPRPLASAREPTPEPRLLVTPGQELKALRAAEDSMLKSYAWVDRKNGIVRIPVDRAIEILAQRGLPTRPQKGAQPASRDKSQEAP